MSNFNFTTKVVIQSATLELTGQQLGELAEANEAFRELLAMVDEAPEGLRPLGELLNAITQIVQNATVLTAPAKKPLSEAQRRAIEANAAKGREAMRQKLAQRENPTAGA